MFPPEQFEFYLSWACAVSRIITELYFVLCALIVFFLDFSRFLLHFVLF